MESIAKWPVGFAGQNEILMLQSIFLLISIPVLYLGALHEDERVALLLEDYDFFVKDTAFFCERLGALTEVRGKATVQDWQARARAGDAASVVRELLTLHYDPGYARSMERNFSQYPKATPLNAADRSRQTMAALARAILKKETTT